MFILKNIEIQINFRAKEMIKSKIMFFFSLGIILSCCLRIHTLWSTCISNNPLEKCSYNPNAFASPKAVIIICSIFVVLGFVGIFFSTKTRGGPDLEEFFKKNN